MQVRAWQLDAAGKTYVIVQATVTDAAGAYSLTNLTAGDYKLDARMAPGVSGNYGDRWYDVEPPSSNGYIGADADVITLADTDALTIDFTLQQLGGFDGRVTVSGAPFAGALVHGERAAEPRIHHNDVTQSGPQAGRFYLRGMVPATDYRFFAHEPSGTFETFVHEGPFAAATNQNALLPDFALQAVTADTNEPNNSSTSAVAVDSNALFRATPRQPYLSAGALIGPRNTGDTDWYCFDALDGDRFLLQAQSVLTLASGTRENPFVDPVLALYTGDGATRLFEDDDSGPLGRDARIDTGTLAAGRYCAVVSTYGDTQFTGTSQGSAGRYQLRIELGNRKPTLAATIAGSPAPTPPAVVTIDEGGSVTFDLAWADPDGDALTATAAQVDSAGAPVTTGTFTQNAAGGTYSWTADQTAARNSPYTLTFAVADAEFTQTVEVVVAINAVNLTPTLPVHVSPADQSTVSMDSQALVIQNATDGDGDPLVYEYELYYGDATTPAQTHTEPQGAGGETSWTATGLPENTHIRWRVRAFDGQVDAGHSPWTAEWSFFVDVANDAPAAPVLEKPAEGDVVLIKRPVLSATTPIDPENDAVNLLFELASDAQFTQGVIHSEPVPASTTGPSTTWTVPQDLPWGSRWFARAYAVDARGGTSAMSNVNGFQIKANASPSVPTFGAPFATACQNVRWTEGRPTSVAVNASIDPEGEPVSVELRILPFDGDPDSATPLFTRTQAQASGAAATSFDVSSVSFTEDQHYRVRARASDGVEASDWAECDFVLDADPGSGVKEGCGCNTTSPASIGLGFLLVALVLSRRRRS